MDDIGVIKDPHNLSNGIGFTNVGQELVSQALPFAGTAHNSCDVDKRHGRRNNALATKDAREGLQSLVRQVDHTDVGLDGGEGVIRRQDRVFRQRVKESRLADVRETYDSNGECHG